MSQVRKPRNLNKEPKCAFAFSITLALPSYIGRYIYAFICPYVVVLFQSLLLLKSSFKPSFDLKSINNELYVLCNFHNLKAKIGWRLPCDMCSVGFGRWKMYQSFCSKET